jgi:hypothetical protein
VKKPSQEDLLGYVLGAMDAQEQRNIDEVLDQNPQLEDDLLEVKNRLLPLDHLDSGGPRPGLARRTCEFVATLQRDREIPAIGDASDQTSTLDPSTPTATATVLASVQNPNEEDALCLGRDRDLGADSWTSKWSLPNMLVTAAALAVFAGLVFPALSYSRYQARLASCQNNLQKIGHAFLKFSDMHEGNFVPIPTEGKLAASGCYGPILKQHGLLEEDSLLSCAGIADDSPTHIPTIAQLQAADGMQLISLKKSMGGDFGYSMGYQENGTYRSPQNVGRTNVVLLADAPSNTLPGRRSSNHGRSGQNCLFEDGRVQFISGHSVGRDAIYENDYGIVAPGSHPDDSVIAPSHLSPLGAVNPKIQFLSLPR